MAEARRHTAIMFTDIVGYTASMRKEETKEFELPHKNKSIKRY